jgi:hypothetical protein
MQNSRTLRRSMSFTNVRCHPGATTLVIATVIGIWGCGGSSAPSSSSTLTPTPSPVISVTVTPNPATVLRGATQSFAATVTGTTITAVIWSVQENLGGTIDSTGLYTAPQGLDGTFHVVATSQANSAVKGFAAVAVQLSQLAISPVTVSLPPSGAQTFTASAVGLANNSVTWTVQEKGGGVINGAGFYTAPSAVGFYHVIATSVEDTTVTASTEITVTTSSSGFTPTGSLQQARGFHTATLLPDGRVLVAGGANKASDPHCIGGIASAELYDASGSFAPTGTLNAPRYAHTAALLQNGKVLVAGGFGDTTDCQDVGVQAQNTAELYDPVTGSFIKTGNMGISRGEHTATVLTNGKVLIAGGGDQGSGGTGSASAELYDQSTGAFIPTGSMTVARFRHTATLLKNGKVLVVGGVPVDSSNPTATAEVYDPTTGSFTVTGSMTTAREEHTATLLANGKVLIVGGESPVTGSSDLQATATAEVYDPSTDSFSITGSMTEGRNSHTATILPSGHVLIAGGGDDNSTAELYDPTTSSFEITGGMEIGRSRQSATSLSTDIVGGVVLVVGGGSSVPLATAELFYEDGNFWDY